jgi:hypothetical protein
VQYRRQRFNICPCLQAASSLHVGVYGHRQAGLATRVSERTVTAEYPRPFLPPPPGLALLFPSPRLLDHCSCSCCVPSAVSNPSSLSYAVSRSPWPRMVPEKFADRGEGAARLMLQDARNMDAVRFQSPTRTFPAIFFSPKIA